MKYDLDRIDRTLILLKMCMCPMGYEREQLFRKKDKNYIDTLMKILKEKHFDGIVLVEFVSGDSEKAFFEDMEKLKRS